MNNQPVKVKRYYGLRLMSIVYKALAVMTVLAAIGAVGYISIDFFNIPYSLRANARINGLYEVINIMLTIGIGGGLLAFILYTLSQVLDVLVSMGDNLRAMARKDELQLSSDTGLQSSNLQIAHELEQLKNAVEQQNRLLRLQVASQPGQPVPPTSTQQTNT
jgi:hypothetical protein